MITKRTRCPDDRRTFLRTKPRVRLWGALSRVDRKVFGTLWALSPAERSGLNRRLSRLRCQSAKVLKKAQRGQGSWQRDLVEDGDVESQPGPSSSPASSTLRLATCNVGGASSAFAALASLCDAHLDVLGLQETRMSPRQSVAWQKEAHRLGFRAWVHPGYQLRDSVGRLYFHHGMAIAVKNTLPAAELFRHDAAEGQCLAVAVAGRPLCFLWQKPDLVDEGGLTAALTGFLEAHPQLVFAGDWNELPPSNAFASDNSLVPFAVKEPSGAFASTRWNGRRAIDYLVGPRVLQARSWFADTSFGDHRAVFFQTTWPVPAAADLTYMVPTRAYGCPTGVSDAVWLDRIAAAYTPLRLRLPPVSEATDNLVQRQWHTFNRQVEQAFLAGPPGSSGYSVLWAVSG